MPDIHEFGQALAAAIADRGGPKMEYQSDDESLVFEDGSRKQIVNLHTFYRMHRTGRSVEFIAVFIMQLQERQSSPLDVETARPLLHLHVVSEDYLEDQGLFRPLGPGLKAALVLDYPDFVRFLVKADLEKIGESEDVLWAIAEVNTDAKMPEPAREQMPNGKESLIFECSMGAVYAWRYATTHGAVICGMPRRDFGFVTTDDTPESFAMLGIATLSYFREAEDHPLSPLAYRFVDGKLAGAGGAITTPRPVRAISLREVLVMYAPPSKASADATYQAFVQAINRAREMRLARKHRIEDTDDGARHGGRMWHVGPRCLR